ncbi:MAG: hypothetical protein U0570_04045 [Phycisphaerales bacterium]
MKQEDFDGVRTLFDDGWDNTDHVEYNLTAIDLDSNMTDGTDGRNAIDLAGYDRVTRTDRSIAHVGHWVALDLRTSNDGPAASRRAVTERHGTFFRRQTVTLRGHCPIPCSRIRDAAIPERIGIHKRYLAVYDHDAQAGGVAGNSVTVVFNSDNTSTETTTRFGFTTTERTLDSTAPTAIEKFKQEYTYDDHGRVADCRRNWTRRAGATIR